MKNAEDIRMASIAGRSYRRKATIEKTPLLTLSGKWLTEAGFVMNDKVQVRILPGKLIITQLIKLPGYKRQIKRYLEKLNGTI
ncbi:SymE family type I addiction module toxin [Chitinophaga sp. CC14]|uniref:SymE family type I addiction module toxin n=1 Tax=Chitinophaga sp. CC14 TaxID=3029199 RepID=UPI003B7F1EAE